MKILALHTSEAGPLGSQVFHFKDDWSGTISTNILFSGPERLRKIICLAGDGGALECFWAMVA